MITQDQLAEVPLRGDYFVQVNFLAILGIIVVSIKVDFVARNKFVIALFESLFGHGDEFRGKITGNKDRLVLLAQDGVCNDFCAHTTGTSNLEDASTRFLTV